MDFEKAPRYDMEYSGDGFNHDHSMEPAVGGDWVRSNTFDALLAAHRETTRALEIADGELSAHTGISEIKEFIEAARSELAKESATDPIQITT